MDHEHAASLTARAVKKVLPESAILTKDARQTLNSATSVFTLYLASLAHETAVVNKRSTITLKDVLQTLRDVDFEHFIEPIESCLQGRFGWIDKIDAVAASETKVAANRSKTQKANAQKDEGGETSNEIVVQIDKVALEEDDENGKMSVDEPSDATENNDNDSEDATEEEQPSDVMEVAAK
ncbi:hypothetical protein CCR75_003790 [Bremia lactucae]|uniref:Transcription factor CBF/NF-Y/archaeal histone domain-containing protein n=1 Tax=Bremia lactucae TaxID=4779 RepID=A0A976IKC5_BRELC|nr:hypothetical protein CCR75_003790 [Bremia lactucae]